MRYETKAFDLGEVLDTAIRLCKDHFRALLLIALVVCVIPLFLFNLYATQAFSKFGNAQTQEELHILIKNNIWPLMGMFYGVIIFQYVLLYPLIHASTIWYLGNRWFGREVLPKDAIKAGLRMLPAQAWAHKLKYLAILVPFFALIFIFAIVSAILPGGPLIKIVVVVFGFLIGLVLWMYLALRLWFVAPVVVIEGAPGTKALARSGQLARNHYMVLLVLEFVFMVLGIALNLLTLVCSHFLVRSVLLILIESAVLMYSGAVLLVMYISARCANESYDLTLLTQQVEQGGMSQQTEQGQQGPGTQQTWQVPLDDSQ